MRKIVPLALASALITACTGNGDGSSSATNVSTSSRSSSSQSTQVSSTPNVSSASSHSSAPNSGGSPSYGDFAANALKGATLYEEKSCSSCHGSDGVLKGNGGTAVNALNVNKYTTQTLFLKIHQEMPTLIGNPEDCEDQCAADITAYLESWRKNDTANCDTSKAIGYSPRKLKLLTVSEYQNSLEDLLGLTVDYSTKIIGDASKGKFPNNSTTNVDENRANKFWSAAEGIAAWAADNDKPFACANGGCAGQFIDGFLQKMFRRPITEAERAQYEEIFNLGGDEGFKFALTAALNSPQFLYRSELGDKVSVLLSTEPESYYRPNPDTLVDWNLKVPDETGFFRLDNYAGAPIPYVWTGKDTVSIVAKGTQNSAGDWPEVKIRLDEKEHTLIVNSKNAKTFRIQVEANPGGGGYMHLDRNQAIQGTTVFIGQITFGAAQLYTPERGDIAKMQKADPSSYMLDPFEYASFLSYTLTGSTPDDKLFEAAANDGLHYEDQIRAQVERLIASPRGRERAGVFAGYWFETDRVLEPGSDRDPALFPEYTMDVRKSMAEEARELFREVFYNDRPFESVYNGDFTVVNSTLAKYYGISSGSSGPNDWQVVDGLDKRGGILTTGAFMTVNAHPDKSAPIIRGVRIREQALCQHIAPPPLLVADRDALLALAEEEYKKGIATTRRYYEVITDSPACAGCHEYQINPMFGTEDFDQVGRWRDSQKGSTGMDLPIKTNGILYGPSEVTDNTDMIEFNGAKGLSKAIADLPGVEACVIEKSFRFVSGLPLKSSAVDSLYEPPLTDEQKADFACVANKAKAAYDSSNHSLKAVITEMVMQDLNRYRKAN